MPQALSMGVCLAAGLVIDVHAAGDLCGPECGGDDDCSQLDTALEVLIAEGELHLLL